MMTRALRQAVRIVSAVLAIAAAATAGDPKPALDVLIFAPHPDDEVIGCAAVIQRALEQKRQVGIVLLTNGDGYPALAAVVARKSRETLTPEDFIRAGALRQQHSLNAATRLGVPRDHLMFLGYPDSGLTPIYQSTGDDPYEQKFTKKRESYAATARDYHSLVHGSPAPYLKAGLVNDIAGIIRDRQPKEIYVTHKSDVHGDHRAAFWFVRDGARAANYVGPIFTYIVHGTPPAQPPDRILTLTKTETETKRAAIQDHQAGTSPIHDHLAEEFTKPEEHFWLFRADTPAATNRR